MVRGLIRLALIVIVVVAAMAFFFGYRWRGGDSAVERPVATSGHDAPLNTDRARAAGAEVGEKMATAANRATEALADGSVTARIKSKIALDDTLNGTRITVDTDDTRVTLGGHVSTSAQRARALQLARETGGVAIVIDRISID